MTVSLSLDHQHPGNPKPPIVDRYPIDSISTDTSVLKIKVIDRESTDSRGRHSTDMSTEYRASIDRHVGRHIGRYSVGSMIQCSLFFSSQNGAWSDLTMLELI